MKRSFHHAGRVLILSLAAALLFCLALPAALAASPEETALPAFGSDEALAEIVEKLNEEYWPIDVGIAVCFTATGECLYYNPDLWLPTASLYKLPMLMVIAREEEAGNGDRYHIFEDMDYAKHEILAFSSNAYGLRLRAVFGENELPEKETALVGLELEETEMNQLRQGKYSPRYYLHFLQELYEHPEHYTDLLEYMKEAQPEEYLRHFMEGQYEIAQKYGSVDYYNHIAGIVYSDPAVLIVIMTSGCGASGGEARIGMIGRDVMAYAETVHARWRDYLAEQEAAAASPEPTPEPTPEPSPAPTAEPTPAPEPSGELPAEPASAAPAHFGVPDHQLVLAGVVGLCAVIFCVVLLIVRAGRRR